MQVLLEEQRIGELGFGTNEDEEQPQIVLDDLEVWLYDIRIVLVVHILCCRHYFR